MTLAGRGVWERACVGPRGGRELSLFSASRSPWPLIPCERTRLVVTSDTAQKHAVSLVVNKAVFIFPFIRRGTVTGTRTPGLGLARRSSPRGTWHSRRRRRG